MVKAADRPEPRAMSVADLAALALGVALAVTFPSNNRWSFAGRTTATSWDWLVLRLPWIAEILQRACLALLPVFVARSIRYAVPVRPTGFLVFCVASPLLWAALQSVPALGLAHPTMQTSRRYVENPVAMRWLIGAACLTMLAIPLARKARPSWIVGGMIAATWALFDHAGMYGLARTVSPLLPPAWPNPSMTTIIARQFIFKLPKDLLLFVPAAASIVFLFRRGRCTTWVERAGVALSLTWWMVSEISIIHATTRMWRGSELIRKDAVLFAMLLLAATLSALLVSRVGPAWNRWLGLGYDEDRAASSISKA